MEISRWHLYIVLNCALLHCLLAKPYSLNDAIAAESQQKQAYDTTSSTKLEGPVAERFSLNKAFSPKSLKFKDLKLADSIIPRGKKISSLKYKKTFQIKSPLKPKKIKLSQKPLYKRKNQSVKREISGNEELNQKYIPLLKSLTMLVDNLLNSDTSDSIEAKPRKHKRNQYYSERRNDVCTCASKSESENAESTSQEKTITSAATLTSEVSITEDLSTTTTQATPSTTDNITVSDISSFRPNTDVPVLLPRNTFSSRGDHIGFSKRSSTSYNRSVEGNIARDNGNSKHNTGCGENESDTESNEENSCGTPRDDASGVRFRAGIRGNGDNARNRNVEIATNETDSISEGETKSAAVDEFRGNFNEFKRENKLETGRDETKSAKFLPKFIRGLRGHVPEDQDDFNAKPIQSKENNEESNLNVSIDNTSYQRIPDRGGTITKENQNINPRNEGVTAKDNLLNSTNTNNSITKTPVVMIIDGYSVTRHKNGQNKLSKKAIHIHS